MEEEESHEGLLEVFHADGPQGGAYHYALRKASGQRLALRFDGGGPNLLTGTSVRVNGIRVEQALALGGAGSLEVLGLPVLPSTFGEHKVLVILLRFLDTPVTTASPSAASVQTTMFGTTGLTVSNFYRENSYQQTWLTGTVVGPLLLPMTGAGCDYGQIATFARQALTTVAGIVLGQFRHVVYAFPTSGCQWWGLGSVGGMPGEVWVNGTLSSMVASHELGHNFGLYHSHALECGSVAMGGSCSTIDYGDVFDVMGGGNGPTHFNAVQKDLLGWLDYGASPPVTDVVASGSYTIEPLETPGTNPKALRIKTALGDWLYVEYRRPVGFDSYISTNASVMNGVLVHYFDGSRNGVYLLDMTPATSSWSDPALPVGSDLPGCGGQGEHHAHRPERDECDRQRHRRRRRLRPAGADRDDHSGAAAGPAGDDRDVHRVRCRTMAPAAAPRSLPFRRSCRRLDGRAGLVVPHARRGGDGVDVASGHVGRHGRRGALCGVAFDVRVRALRLGRGNLHRDGGGGRWGGGAAGASPTASIAPTTRRPSAMAGHPWSGSFQIVSGEARNQASKVLHMAVRPELQGVAQTVSTTFASASNNVAPRFGVVLHYLNAAKLLPVLPADRRIERAPDREGGQWRGDGTEVRDRRQSGSGLALHAVLPGDGGHADAPARRGDEGHRGGSGCHRLRQRGLRNGGSSGGGISHRADDFSAIVQ